MVYPYRSPVRGGRALAPAPVQEGDARGLILDVFEIQKILGELREVKGFFEQLSTDTQKKINEAIATFENEKRVAKGVQGLSIKGEPGRDADEKTVADLLRASIMADLKRELLQEVPALVQVRHGEDGESPDIEDVAALVLSKIDMPSPVDTDALMRQIITRITDGTTLTPDHIAGLDKKVRQFWDKYPRGYVHGGGVTALYAGSGITVTRRTDGNYTITAIGGLTTNVRDEVPSGSGTAFTLAHTPAANTLQLFRGGARQSVANGDYTISTTHITLTVALAVNETLTADYEY